MADSFELPVVPLQEDVLFPEATFPILLGRQKAIDAVKAMDNQGQDRVAVIKQKDSSISEPERDDLYEIGTEGRIREGSAQNGQYQVIITGLHRVQLKELVQEEPYLIGKFEFVETTYERTRETEAQFESLRSQAINIAERLPTLPAESAAEFSAMDDPERLTDFIAANLQIDTLAGEDIATKQDVLSETNLADRMEKVHRMLRTKIQAAEMSQEIDEELRKASEEQKREYYLRQQLKAIKKKLGEDEGDAEELQQRLRETKLPKEVEEKAQKQIDRLQIMQPASSEYGVAHNYVEWLLDFPWYTRSADRMNLDHAEEILENDHYALEDPKERILQFLAVRTLKDSMQGPTLCLVGPPGVGKTSLAKSVARSLGRKFIRMSLGGIKDESEIRGHRRTYVGAIPGRIVQKMERAGTKNPVILLDEVDKISRSMQGDPEAALLEVLDPEQNETFNDHYMDVDIDLSEVLFITTANQLEGISNPLRDRMEIIEVPSYTPTEKVEIAKRHLLPEQIEEKGIEESHLEFGEEALSYLTNRYTKEAGVRELKRRIGEMCRHVAIEVVNNDDITIEIDQEYIREKLGPEEHRGLDTERVEKSGVATGLAYTSIGGDVLFIEAKGMDGTGDIQLTGSLGDVMEESAEAAISHLQSHPELYDIDTGWFDKHDLHIHAPEGAVPKDGPSAGITIFAAVLSLLRDEPLPSSTALTGEITLRGEVLKVGGIREKAMAAHRAGVDTVLLPEHNEKDLDEITDEAREEISFHPVSEVTEVEEILFEEDGDD